MELLERAITVMKKHLADKTAYEWTACHISDEMKSIIRDYESIPIEPPVKPEIAEDADLLDMTIHYVELLGVRNYSVFGNKKEVATRNKILKFRDWLKTLENNSSK